jgi:hypothetical protein
VAIQLRRKKRGEVVLRHGCCRELSSQPPCGAARVRVSRGWRRGEGGDEERGGRDGSGLGFCGFVD